MGKKKAETKTSGKTVSTPNAPAWLKAPAQGQANLITGLQGRDASDFVTGASPLQSQAFSMASQRFGGAPSQQSKPAVSESPSSFSMGAGTRSSPDQRFQVSSPPVSEAPTQQPNFSGVRNGFNDAFNVASQAGNTEANLADTPNGYEAAQYGGTELGDASQAREVEMGAGGSMQAQSLLDGFEDYQNPYTEQVVDATMADYDENAGRTRADQAAQAARNGAFGGSRFAIRESMTEDALGRSRASLGAGLRSDSFNTAARLSGEDANRRQSASSTNAQLANTRTLAKYQGDSQRSLFDASAANTANLAQGQLDQQTGLFNTGAENESARFNEGLFAQNNQFNAGQEDRNSAMRLQASGRRRG